MNSTHADTISRWTKSLRPSFTTIYYHPIWCYFFAVDTYVRHCGLRHVKQKQATLLQGMKNKRQKTKTFLIFERTGLHSVLNSTRKRTLEAFSLELVQEQYNDSNDFNSITSRRR